MGEEILDLRISPNVILQASSQKQLRTNNASIEVANAK